MFLVFNNYRSIQHYFLKKTKKEKNLILCGGSTIKKILLYLDKKNNFLGKKILLSDERLVKKNSNFRNDNFYYKIIRRRLITYKDFINYKFAYQSNKELKRLNETTDKINFSSCLLSLGSKGHIAGIFDNKKKIKTNFYFSYSLDKKPKNRVTISINKLLKCKKIYIVVDLKRRMYELKTFKRSIFYKKNARKFEFLLKN